MEHGGAGRTGTGTPSLPVPSPWSVFVGHTGDMSEKRRRIGNLAAVMSGVGAVLVRAGIIIRSRDLEKAEQAKFTNRMVEAMDGGCLVSADPIPATWGGWVVIGVGVLVAVAGVCLYAYLWVNAPET